MTPRAEKRLIAGPAGRIEVALDWPLASPVAGVACIGHPHPLYGGTMDNKVAATIARTFAALGWLAVRFNFRGVGSSDGTHDAGHGETEDFLHVLRTVPTLPGVPERLPPTYPLALAGFSFGSFVAARAAEVLADGARPADYLVLVGAAAGKWPMPEVRTDTLVIHGESDETIALPAVLDWARPRGLPVLVIPGADHFFHRKLPVLKARISAHIRGMSQFDAAEQSH
ncbi:MAG TPA: alpha/beta hydrolase [Burkholderiaceae bacterium]|nr:alpha/beta hydrolase [Burkholderiaceae bacterium]